MEYREERSKTPRQERALINAMIFVAARLTVYMGLSKDWRVNLIPAEYVGYFVAFLGVPRVAGVNIWFHGPLDPKNDAERSKASEGSK